MIPFIEKLLNRRKHHARPKKIKAKQGHCWRGIPNVPSKKSLGTYDADGFTYEGFLVDIKKKAQQKSKFHNFHKSNI